jgi:hypothetical protein
MTTVSRDRFQKALSSLKWDQVQAVLDAAGGAAALDISEVASTVTRTSALLFRYPAPASERKREKMLEALRAYFASADTRPLDEAFETLLLAESGYRRLVSAIGQTEAGKLPPGEQATAAISLSERAVADMAKRLEAQAAERSLITTHMALREDDGRLVSPDAALEHLVNIAGMTLQMHAHQQNWFDGEGVIVAPLQDTVSEDSVFKVGSLGFLAVIWKRWENTEERARFIGRSLKSVPRAAWPPDAPDKLQQLVQHVPEKELELLHQVAFERYRDWLGQNFFEMVSEMAVEHLEVGDKPGPHALPPKAIVSREELHAASAVAYIVHYDIAKDMERPGGVRLLEWVRGYAALDKVAAPADKSVRIAKSHSEWLDFFVHWGLSSDSAAAFIKALTFRKGSRDLFDHPLVK